MQENRGSCLNGRGTERAGLSMCECVKGKLAEDRAGLGGSGSMTHGLMGH